MLFASEGPFTISQFLPDEGLWQLRNRIYCFGSKYTDQVIIIESGTISDGSTIPRWAWWYIGHPLEGDHGHIGFFHDEICRRKLFPRKICDLMYLEAHENAGTPYIKRQLQYRAVRLNSIIKGYE